MVRAIVAADAFAARCAALGLDVFDANPNGSPLCIEEFDLSDRNFRPCPCGYQVRSPPAYFLMATPTLMRFQ